MTAWTLINLALGFLVWRACLRHSQEISALEPKLLDLKRRVDELDMQPNGHWNKTEVAEYLRKPVFFWDPKACHCGKVHYKTTPGAIVCKRGKIWFNCACGSTLLVPGYERRAA